MRASTPAKRAWLDLLSPRLNRAFRTGRCLSVFRALAFAAAFAPGSALAETQLPRIDYAAPPSCPDESRFVELVWQRVRSWPKRAEQQSLVAHVRVEAEDEAAPALFVGRLALEDPSGASLGEREIHERSCEEVVLALALFLAVALESETAQAGGLAGAPLETDPIAPSRVAGRAAEKKASASAPVPPAPGTTWNVVAGAHAVTGRTPEVAAGASAALELRPRTAWPVAPYAGLGVDVVPYSTASEGRGDVVFGWAALVGTGCVAFEGVRERLFAGTWEPWLCARAEAGGLRAVSRGYDINQARIRSWLAAGGEVGLAWWLRPDFALTLGGGASIPFIRQAFVVNEARIYRSPAVTAELGLGIKVRAW